MSNVDMAPTRRVRLSDGTELAVWLAGTGPPLLMVHGFPLDHRMWDRQVQALRDEFQCIVPDLRGFGKSSVTEGTVTMERMADDLAELLSQLGVTDRVTLCALSMGGYIAWQFWQRHGDRLQRLVLCNTRSESDSAEVAKGRVLAASQYERDGVRQLSEDMSRKLLSPDTYSSQPDTVAMCRQWILDQPPAGAAAAQRGMAARPDMTDQLGNINVPALVIAGEHDTITPADAMQAMARRMPRADWQLIPRCGHLSPVEQPETLSAALREFCQR